MACDRGPVRCDICYELTQRLDYHLRELHEENGIPRHHFPPMTHTPNVKHGIPGCICGKPIMHHFHGYDLDCQCPESDCRPQGQYFVDLDRVRSGGWAEPAHREELRTMMESLRPAPVRTPDRHGRLWTTLARLAGRRTS